MTLNELKERVDKAVDAGDGELLVAYGDCNTLHMVSGIGKSFVEDIKEYYLEEVDPDSGEGVPIYVIGE